MEKWHLCSWNMKSVETQLGKEREIRKKITNHLIIRQLMNILILDCPLQVCRKDSYWKKKKCWFQHAFVRVGYGSWEEKCPGTKDSPHICARGPEFTKHFHISYLCLHALTGARLSSSLSLPVSAPGFVYLEHHTAAGSSPGAAMRTCRWMPTHTSALVCLSPRTGLLLMAFPPHPLRFLQLWGHHLLEPLLTTPDLGWLSPFPVLLSSAPLS